MPKDNKIKYTVISERAVSVWSCSLNFFYKFQTFWTSYGSYIQKDERKEMIETDAKYDLVVSCITDNQDSLYRLAYSYTKDRHNALDIVQNTVLRALEGYEKLRDPAAVKSWLFKITVNEANRYMSKNNREIPKEPSEMPEETYIEKSYERKEGNEIYEAVLNLPEALKTVVILRYFEDMSLKEISMATDTALSTVKTRLYAAHRRLERILEKEVRL